MSNTPPKSKKYPRSAIWALVFALIAFFLPLLTLLYRPGCFGIKVDPMTGKASVSSGLPFEIAIVVPICLLAAFILGLKARLSIKQEPAKLRGAWCAAIGMYIIIPCAIPFAIVVPYFLDASIRTKTRTVQQVMLTKANVINTYYDDHKQYPPWTSDPLKSTLMPKRMPTFQTIINESNQPTLTTPFPYIKNYYRDGYARSTEKETFAYYSIENKDGAKFILVSWGPDANPTLTSETLKLAFTEDGKTPSNLLLENTYDTTNGVTSAGDIWVISGKPDFTTLISNP